MRFPVKAILAGLGLTGFLFAQISRAQKPSVKSETVHVKFCHYNDTSFVTDEWDVAFSDGAPDVNYAALKANLPMELPFNFPADVGDPLQKDSTMKNRVQTFHQDYIAMCFGEVKGPVVTLAYDSAGRVTRYSAVPALYPYSNYAYSGTVAPFDYQYWYSPTGKLTKAVCTKQAMTKTDFPIQVSRVESLRFQYDEKDRMTEARYIGADFSGWTMYFTYP